MFMKKQKVPKPEKGKSDREQEKTEELQKDGLVRHIPEVVKNFPKTPPVPRQPDKPEKEIHPTPNEESTSKWGRGGWLQDRRHGKYCCRAYSFQKISTNLLQHTQPTKS